MLAKVSNDFSPPIRKNSCRLSSCVNVCLHCVIANRHSVLSCRRSLTAPMIAPHSCAWQRLSQHSLLACAVRRKRLVSLNARKSCDSWLKTFWSARIPSPFVTAFRFLQVRPKTEDPTTQTLEIAFCVRGVVSPALSNILLTPFDREMRLRGYQLTRYADDWVVTCKSAAEARSAVDAARRILKQLGVELHPQKTRIVHVQHGFEFLGYKIKRGKKLHLPESKIRSQARSGALYAYPREKSIQRFQDQVRQRTKRRVPLHTKELIAELNPLLRGWGEYYKRAHVRKLFNQLDRWIVRRIWSHRFKRWRNGGLEQMRKGTLYGGDEVFELVGVIPFFPLFCVAALLKMYTGKTFVAVLMR